MENAVKALLIAASVMVAILIISLGISIYNSSSGIGDEASSTLESTAAFAFNERFTSYMSKSASGSTAKTLVNKIMQHNMSIGLSSFSAGDHHILLNLYYNDNNSRSKLEHCWETTDLKKIYNKISNGKRYDIHVTDCDNYPGGYYNG